MAALPAHIRGLASRQHGVIGRWQMDPPVRRQIQRLMHKGQAQAITPSTYLLACTTPTADQLLWAGFLHCGPQAAVAGRSALGLSGWRDAARKTVHVLVPRHRHPHQNPGWLAIHRSCRFPTSRLGSLPRVDPHLAAVQAASWAVSESEVLYVLTSALQQRIITADRLRQTAREHPNTRRRGLVMEIAAEFVAGMQSMDERRFARLCRKFGLPTPRRQTRRMDASGVWRYTDAEFTMRDGRTLIVEIDGMHHLDPDNWLHDIDRQNDLMLTVDGLLLRVATWTLGRDPWSFLSKVAPLV